jgi:hypothetical protein
MTDGGLSDGTERTVEEFYQEREEQYRQLNIREHFLDQKYIVDCPGCGQAMVLGERWMGCNIPECPACNDTADSWMTDPTISEERAERLADGSADITELVRS